MNDEAKGFHPLAWFDTRVSGLVSGGAAWSLYAVGVVLAAVSVFLAWDYDPDFGGDLTVYGYPGGVQIFMIVLAVLGLLFWLAGRGVRPFGALTPGGAVRALQTTAWGALVLIGYTVFAIGYKLGGLVNVASGGWVALVAALLLVLASRAMPADRREPGPPRAMPDAVQILVITAVLVLVMLVLAYGLSTDIEEVFVAWVITVAFVATAMSRAGLVSQLSAISAKHRATTVTAAFISAFLFPLTQSSDANTSIAANILIFATVALGLNIVVGLAGLLDLGYVAFLGVGAYVGANVSGSNFSPFKEISLPFWLAALCGAAASAFFGVLIGWPTLRLRGDYLAIVTLGFGEIFRLTAQNLDGTDGPLITAGSRGIPGVPDLEIFGFNFGEPHTVAGFTIGRFGNYYLLLLLVMAIIVVIFTRANDSRIGRAWVAIREDETAAGAMGINTFRLKLLAFALGACLAGLGGTVQAHVTSTVTPDQYIFLNSAFLLAAVVLGGMGTIAGPLLGATLLLLIPEKLRFFQDYRLMLFGLALVIIMRFRPEGIVPSTRRRLEFHEEELTAEEAQIVTAGAAAQEVQA